MRVYLAQCLCPQRHAMMASAGEAADQAEAETEVLQPLREAVALLQSTEVMNPWCSLCNAPASSWTYELRRTRWRTMAEAEPHLREQERENLATNAVYGDLDKWQRAN